MKRKIVGIVLCLVIISIGINPVAAIFEEAREMQVDQLREMGFTGEGVRIAIIDEGFYGYEEISNIGEVKSFRADSKISPDENRHGIIVSEIYRNISCGELSLYTVSSGAEFARAVDHIIEQGDIRIILSCLSFFEGMPKEDSISSRAVDKARDNGIMPIIAAGNLEERYYCGNFTDTNGNGLHEFNKKGEKIDETQDIGFMPKESEVASFLFWSDKEQDYDIFLLKKGITRLETLGYSNDRQIKKLSLTQTIEGFTTITNISSFLYVAIYRRDNNGDDRDTELELYATVDLQYASGNSITSPAAAKGAIAVGAVEPGSREIRPYSSCGNISFVGISQIEPYPVEGTSIATPLVAGAFALLMSAYPEATNEQILAALQETAIDLGAEGKDTIYGYGLPQVYDAYEYLLSLQRELKTPENTTINETINSSEAVMITNQP